MAINYTNLFTDLGKIVKESNTILAEAQTLEARRQAIQDQLNTNSQDRAVQTLIAEFDSFGSNHVALQQSLAVMGQNRLLDKGTVLDEIGEPTASAGNLIPLLIWQMGVDSQTINRSVVGIGSVTSVGTPSGDGVILVTKALDGVTPPGSGLPSNINYAGLDSELSIAETMYLTCTGDSSTGNADGAEQFQIDGEYQDPSGPLWGYFGGGSGVGPSATVINGNGIVSNGSFETSTGNSFDSWDVDSGTPGTHIKANAVEFFRGAQSLEFVGDASQNPIRVSQVLGALTARKTYLISVRVKASATPTVGDLELYFEGTGYTSSKLTVSAASITTSWAHQFAYVTLSDDVPSDLELVVRINGALDNAKSVYVDSVAVGEPVWHNGLGFSFIAGASPWKLQDRYSVAITNTEGVFQSWFRKQFRYQLPSSATPTISDTLAT